MHKYHFRPYELLKEKTAKDLGLDYTSVQRLELRKNIEIDTGENEICLVVIKGEANFKCKNDQGMARFKDMLYIPRNQNLKLYASDSVLMLYRTPSDRDSLFTHIEFSDVDKKQEKHKVYGNQETNCKRHVWHFIDSDFECSRLMMGICEGAIGGWTAWPPHEHAKSREEVYVYFDMGNSFGVQCVYDDMENPYTVSMVREGDLITIPKGYHPNACCPGGKISYVYCMIAKTAGQRDFMDLNIQQEFGYRFE